MNDGAGALLLDTHVWFWLINGDEADRLRPHMARINARCAAARVFVSPISAWEIGTLVAKKKLHLDVDPVTWVSMAVRVPAIAPAPLTPRVAVESTRLPGDFHQDPADRIIVATARNLGAAVVTADKRIHDYAAQGHVDVLSL